MTAWSNRSPISWRSIALLSCALLGVTILIFSISMFFGQQRQIVVSSIPPPPRIPHKEYSHKRYEEITDQFFGLKGEEAICSKKFIHDYLDKQLDYCLAMDAGRDVAGGCYHLVGGGGAGLDLSVAEAAMLHCAGENQSAR